MFKRTNVRPSSGSAGTEMLTRREEEVARLVSQGLANKVVAGQLGLQEGTVKVHLNNIYRKLQVPNRTGLILRSIANHAKYWQVAGLAVALVANVAWVGFLGYELFKLAF